MEGIFIKEFSTPLGEMIAGATTEGLCLLDFKSQRSERKIKEIEKLLGTTVIKGENEYLSQAWDQLQEYFDHKRREFTVKLFNPGTEFQCRIWNSIRMIPFGTTVTYEKHSSSLQMPLAIRAVAHAVGSNRILIIVPCHRILGKNGNLTGYAGGLERKRQLLDLESGSSLFGLEY